MLRTAQRCEKLFALAFVKAMKRVNIGTAIAIFGEEPGYRFRRMVGAHHDAVSHTGDAILRFHSLTRFFIAANKIAQLNSRFAQRLFAGEDGAFNIDGEYSVRLNKSNGVLAILFIGLHAIRQTNGDKLQRIITGLFPQFGDSHLAEFPGQRRILPAADA